MNKKLIRKMLTASGGPIKYISDIYLKLSDSPLASTIYDGTNLALYAAAPFTGGATLIPAMTMTGLQATGASANIYDKGLNFLNGTDIASAIPGFGLLNKGVKLVMKPTMKMVGKTTKRVKNAVKYFPKKESKPYTYTRMERVGNSGSRRVIRPVEHTIELGRYHPTFWLLAKEDKKYWPAAALVYGEDTINHGLNTYLVVKDIDLKKQGGKMNILEFLKNGSGIHIKPKNRGKFTKYCHGKVTDECIRKAKASGNPTLVKRATFALNSRHWKHEKGGKAFVKGVNVLDSNPNAYKYVKNRVKKALQGTKFLSKQWFNNAGNNIGNFLNSDTGKGLLNIGSLIFNGIKTGADVADFSNSFDLATDSTIKAMDSKMKADSYKQGLLKAKEYILLKLLENPDTHFGEVDLMNLANNFSNEFYDSQAIEDYKTQRANEKLLSMQAILDSAGSPGIFSLLLKGLGMITEGSKKSSDNVSSNLNLLNYSTIGKSTNPYMYTGLGANTSTFFTK